MFDSIGFQELVLIGLVGLLVVGPKQLPLLMRKAGQWMNKMRGMAADFRATFDEMARQAELDELRKEVEALRDSNPLREIKDELSKPFDTANAYQTPEMTSTPSHEVFAEPETPAVPPAAADVTEKPKRVRKPRAKKVIEDAAA
jgi:sec-independent protein translocase protein TatB